MDKTLIIPEANGLDMRGRKRVFDILIEKDEDGYFVASVPALPGCHTQAKSLDVLMKRIQEAIKLYLEVCKDSASLGTRVIGIRKVEVTI